MVGGVGGVARDRVNEDSKSMRRRSSLQTLLVSKIETEDPISPDTSDCNQMDVTAAQYFYKQCQLLGIQLVLIPNEVGSKRRVVLPLVCKARL
jgi:hypothetical protein